MPWQYWNGAFFERSSLKSLGLRLQLGHIPGTFCVSPKRAVNDSFVILDTNGIHDVGLSFCGCLKAQPHTIQLLRAQLYPSSGTSPTIAITFRALEFFHILGFEAKCSVFEFHNTLARLRDNTGSQHPKDVYKQLLRMVRQWRNLKQLKRGGRGHATKGIAGTCDGQLALACPACPQPGINLPSEWSHTTPLFSWIYTQFLALDGNFRMKRKKVSSSERDPSLTQAWLYFVDEQDYGANIERTQHLKQERSTCVNHSAVNNSEHESKDLASTGLISVDCSRHNMKRANATGCLQKGERYINSDYCFLRSLKGTELIMFVVSYDIACQWSINLWSRMLSFSEELRFDSTNKYITFLVPKFHLPAHILRCNILFSFHLRPHVGRTDGEAPERGWSNINGISAQTKEMGPGSFQDTVNDYFGDWNWKKIVRLGELLLKKIKKAVPGREEHLAEFRAFETSLARPEDVSEWKAMLESWEADSSNRNPYQRATKDPSLQQVRNDLAKEEAKVADHEALLGSDAFAIETRLSPSELVARGLQLELDQSKLDRAAKLLGAHSTDKQLADHQLAVNRLHTIIETWNTSLALSIPDTARLRAYLMNGGSGGRPSSDVSSRILLPSTIVSLAETQPGAPPCTIPAELEIVEFRMREGQAHDALNEMRNALRVRTQTYKHKDRFVSGIRANTRANGTIKKIQDAVDHHAKTYRSAWKALSSLGPRIGKSDWGKVLRRLEDKDIRGMTDPEAITMPGGRKNDNSDGRKTTSWIWLTAGISDGAEDDPGLHEALRIEWCRSRSRAMRWSEEVILLQEEMRRVLSFLDWEAKQWRDRAVRSNTSDKDPNDDQGRHSYAMRQSHQREGLRQRFMQIWRFVPIFVEKGYSQWKRIDDVGMEGRSEEDCVPPLQKTFHQELELVRERMEGSKDKEDPALDLLEALESLAMTDAKE